VAAHAKLIAETDLKYPIILSADGRVMDGMHRVCKAFINNSDTLSAVQFEVNPAPDYIDVDIICKIGLPESRRWRAVPPGRDPAMDAGPVRIWRRAAVARQ